MEFLHNDKKSFAQAVELVVSKQNLRPEIVEKDYYVTMILRLLSEKLPFIVFKGGTSLSKCHKAINRFSEDIDITFSDKLSQGERHPRIHHGRQRQRDLRGLECKKEEKKVKIFSVHCFLARYWK